MAHLRKKIVVIICGIFFSLIILEIGLRAGGFIFSSLQEYRNKVSIRRNGSYSYKIMCLGESTTARQYPGPLEEILNKRNIGIRFSVIDKGIVGTNTFIILSQLKQNLDIYKPDMVIVMAGYNDVGIKYYEDIPEATTGVFQHCSVYRFIRLIYMHIVKKLKEQDIRGLVRVNPKKSATLPDLRTCHEKTKEALKNDIMPHTQNDNKYLELGWAYKNQDKLLEAEESFNKAIELNPKNAEAYIQLGMFYRSQGKFLQAEDLLKKAIELNPKNDNAYIQLVWFYQEQGKLSQAEEAFNKAIELNPKNDNIYFELGRFYQEQGKFLQAEDLLKKAIELNPKNAEAYIQLGMLYREQGKLSQAEEAFNKAIELNPKNDNAYVELGWLYQEQGKFLQAEDLLKKAIELNPKNDNAYRAILVLYETIGKPGLAKEYAQKVNRLSLWYYNPVTVNNYHKLKEILDKRGIRLVCAQYPLRSIEPLKKIFEKDEGVIFVDNESVFREALKKASYREYFRDMFGGDFGHCTEKGNRLLAQNIANVILQEIFQSIKD